MPTVSFAYLLPAEWDWKRLRAEQAVAWRRDMKHMVIKLIAMRPIWRSPPRVSTVRKMSRRDRF